jgi:hypothetical protein
VVIRKLGYDGILALLCLATVWPIANAIVQTRLLWVDSRRRTSQMRRQAECNSQSCQVIFSEAQAGGVCGLTDKTSQVTAEALSGMAVLIANLR